MPGSSPHIMIVEARFYDDLADEMAAGAIAALEAAGATYERFAVPGSFEVPAAIRFAIEADGPAEGGRKFDGYVALGCVIRGETTHYDYVCQESARALQDLAVNQQAAIGYGILTCENGDQAWARAGRSRGNKGKAAVEACLAMVALRRRFQLP
jgi:6,7-dimethyl-8-ribityllumazine synthase